MTRRRLTPREMLHYHEASTMGTEFSHYRGYDPSIGDQGERIGDTWAEIMAAAMVQGRGAKVSARVGKGIPNGVGDSIVADSAPDELHRRGRRQLRNGWARCDFRHLGANGKW